MNKTKVSTSNKAPDLKTELAAHISSCEKLLEQMHSNDPRNVPLTDAEKALLRAAMAPMIADTLKEMNVFALAGFTHSFQNSANHLTKLTLMLA